MCGIAGYSGKEQAAPFLIEALRRMEYRGYDSFGILTLNKESGTIEDAKVYKDVGELPEIMPQDLRGDLGIAHNRWATNGNVCVENAHPISNRLDQCYVVHNGIIENYQELLLEYGYKPKTNVDSEIIAEIYGHARRQGMNAFYSVAKTISKIKGQYAFIIAGSPAQQLICAANGSPLYLTLNGYIASDINALAEYSEFCFRLPDKCVAIYDVNGFPTVYDEHHQVLKSLNYIRVHEYVQKTKTSSVMLDEIQEQEVVPLDLRYNHGFDLDFRPERVTLFGCGSSYNAALLGRHYLETISRIPTKVEYASDFIDRPIFDLDTTTFIAMTQSGETKDVLLCLERLKDQAPIVVTNNPHSSAVRLAEKGSCVSLNCGPEQAVAATKSFTAQGLRLLEMAGVWSPHGDETPYHIEDAIIQFVYDGVKSVLANKYIIEAMSDRVIRYQHILYLGRRELYAIAREGALKMNEVAYIHSSAMQASEVKHGPLALIDKNTLSIFLLGQNTPEKVIANMEEVRARNGDIIVFADEETPRVKTLANLGLFVIPKTNPLLLPLLINVPLQLLAYYCGEKLGHNTSKPRNLAKSVTV